MSNRKAFCQWAAMALIAAAAGCATQRADLVLDTPAGPYLATGGQPAGQGSILVYPMMEPTTFPEYPFYNHYTAFTIYDANGALVKVVPSTRDSLYPAPNPVQLPAGRYRIVAKTPKLGLISIPVVVKGDQNTILFLDGKDHPEAASADPARALRLPTGQIYGWRATE